MPDGRVIQKLVADYHLKTGFTALAVEHSGQTSAAKCQASSSRVSWRRGLTMEALRWGEPCAMTEASGLAGWGGPLMINSLVTGGIIVEGVALDEGEPSAISRRICSGCRELLKMVEAANLTNAELLKSRREESRREREKAEAIHLLKTGLYDRIRELYLKEEPGLLAAI